MTPVFSQRTCTCSQLRSSRIGEAVVLNGWVKGRRDLGSLIFVDLRDRYGVTQVVFDPGTYPGAHEDAKELGREFVIAVRGKVRSRGDQVNRDMPTGEIEVLADALEILSVSKTPPFPLDDAEESDDTRLTYRYLDLRRPHLREALEVRHKATLAVRNYLDKQGFLEIETPMLTKSTPEGARDYLVPSRVHPGSFFALPQSPQLLKQLLMVAGADKYFQICRCFRDEDMRADRQPEFTQIDLEMSFATQDDVLTVTEGCIAAAFAAGGIDIETPFPRLAYSGAMDKYGTDKPDLRFCLPLTDVTEIVGDSAFNVFRRSVKGGGVVKALRVPEPRERGTTNCGTFARGVVDQRNEPRERGTTNTAVLTRAQIDELGRVAEAAGAKGVIPVKYQPGGGRKSTLTKFLTEDEWARLDARTGATEGDLLLMLTDAPKIANAAMAAVRVRVGEMLGLVKPGEFSIVWVTDFPLFTYDDNQGRWVSEHHPFTSPRMEDMHLLDSVPGRIRSCSYDLVINGFETGSGSVRIHDRAVQETVFEFLRLSREEVESRFGFFLDALEYGAPPHAGFAVGLDRLIMLMLGRGSLRDVIAFPKTQKAADLMTGAPSEVRREQLDELQIGGAGKLE